MKKYVEDKIDIGYISISDLLKLLEQYKNKEEVYLSVDINYEYGDSYINSYISYFRKETLEEKEERIKKEKIASKQKEELKKLNEEKEYEQFLLLKAKYEK